jgi:hypothetical protein
MSLAGGGGPLSTYKYPHTVPEHGDIDEAFGIPC